MQQIDWDVESLTATLKSGELVRILIKRNPSQKSIRLRAHLKRGLSLSCSPGVSKRDIQDFVVNQEEWIERQCKRLTEVKQEREIEKQSIPLYIYFEFLGKRFPIVTRLSKRKYASCKIDFEDAIIHFDLPKDPLLETELVTLYKKMLLMLAKHCLIPHAQGLLDNLNVRYTSVEIRNATTRWGSCTTHKRIMLSTSLLFVKPELVDSVLYHEASHLTHMNHGKNFYKLLNSYDAKYKEHHEALKRAHARLPWYCK